MFNKILITVLSLLIILAIYPSGYALTKDNYTEIYNREDMESIANNPNGNFILMADINMADKDWNPIEFNGVFDGNNHIIYNLNLTELNSNPSITIDGNHKEYQTYFSALFSKCENALIKNLTLLNVKADINTEKHCFVAGLVGNSINTDIINCHVIGRMYLYSSNIMSGIGGIVGFGTGNVNDSSANVTLVLVDNYKENKCEEFIGGIWACGYPNIENCDVVLDAYATTHSYTHNGGIIGMHHIHTRGLAYEGYIKNCTVDAVLSLFEHSFHGHQHNGSIAGERLNRYVDIDNNTVINYEEKKYPISDTLLLPDKCEQSEYTMEITEYTCTEFGYTTYTCKACGYSYTDNYTPPAHKPSQWQIVKEPTYEEAGLKNIICLSCGEILEQKEIPKLIYISTCKIDKEEIEIAYKSTSKLNVEISPNNAYNTEVLWSSSNESAATVDTDGKVTAAGKGTAVITCMSADANAQSECIVTVKYTFKQWLIIIFLFGWIWY